MLLDLILDYKITKFNNHCEVELLNHGRIIIKFIDLIDDPKDFSTFTRIINNHILKNGVNQFKKLKRTTNFLTPFKTEKAIINRIITLDIETRVIENIITPYSMCC